MQFLGIYWGEVLGRSGKRSVDDWGVTNNLSQVQIHNMCSAVRDGGRSDYTVICAKRLLVINAGAWMYGRSSNTVRPGALARIAVFNRVCCAAESRKSKKRVQAEAKGIQALGLRDVSRICRTFFIRP